MTTTKSTFPQTSDLIETSTAKKIRRLLQGTARRSQFSFLFGPTGRGKTFVTRDWLRGHGNGAYVRAVTGATQARLRKQISQAIFNDEHARERDITEHILAHPGFVLIVDEVNHLIANANLSSARNLDSIRDYYDEVQDAGGSMGVCFIFTEYTLDRLRNCRMASFLQQFINRCDNHLNIGNRISRAYEIVPTVRAYIPDADDALINAACAINDIRAIHKRFSAAKELSARTGQPITAKMIEAFQAQFNSGDYPDEN